MPNTGLTGAHLCSLEIDVDGDTMRAAHRVRNNGSAASNDTPEHALRRQARARVIIGAYRSTLAAPTVPVKPVTPPNCGRTPTPCEGGEELTTKIIEREEKPAGTVPYKVLYPYESQTPLTLSLQANDVVLVDEDEVGEEGCHHLHPSLQPKEDAPPPAEPPDRSKLQTHITWRH